MSDITEHPPVPQLLQKKLKDHPEIIADIQGSLNRGGRRPGMRKTLITDQVEAAIWRLEDGLIRCMSDAAEKLKLVESGCDPVQIAKAEAKWRLMANCRRSVSDCLDELGTFFGRCTFRKAGAFIMPSEQTSLSGQFLYCLPTGKERP